MKVYIGRYPKDETKERKIDVRIDDHDLWSADHTLAYIILPLLKKFRAEYQGAPYVDNDDVPEQLRSTHNDDTGVDDTRFAKWEYVLDEMIFAFESKMMDWEEQFWIRKPVLDLSQHPGDDEFTPVPWIDKGECDWAGMDACRVRISNGFKLFGKYYEGLWT